MKYVGFRPDSTDICFEILVNLFDSFFDPYSQRTFHIELFHFKFSTSESVTYGFVSCAFDRFILKIGLPWSVLKC